MKSWQYIWKLARFRVRLYLLCGLFTSLLFYLFPLVPGLIALQFFDALASHAPDKQGLWILIALLVAAELGRIAALFGAAISEITLNMVASALIRKNILEHILLYPKARAVPASSGEAISRFRNDVQAVVSFIRWTVDPLGQAAVIIVALIVLVRIDWFITFTVFLPLLGVLALVNITGKRIEKYRKANQESIGEVTDLLGEIFGAVQAVKVAGAEQRVVEYFHRVNETRRKATLKDILFSQGLNSIFTNAANIGTGVILLLGAQSIRSGTFTVGDFALFVSYLTWLAKVTTMFGAFLTQYRQVGVSLERLIALLPGVPTSTLVKHSPVYLNGKLPELSIPQKTSLDHLDSLDVLELTYKYPESSKGIENITLHIRRGNFTVITGRIGAGKTTLLRVLMGLLPKESGTICWNGINVDSISTFFVPPHSAYTPQVPRLFSETLKENILLGLPEHISDITSALQAAILEPDVAGLDEGLDTRIGPRGVKLSGGQVQRTAAARMFVRKPELLVVDDLSSALDVVTEKALWDQLLVREDVTCLAVSHRRAALQRADHIIVLKDGKVEAAGKLSEILISSQEFQQLWWDDRDTPSTTEM